MTARECVHVSIDWQSITRAYCREHDLLYLEELGAYDGRGVVFRLKGLSNKFESATQRRIGGTQSLIAHANVAPSALCCRVRTVLDEPATIMGGTHDLEFYIM